MIILGIESSCDETSAAVVEMDSPVGNHRILSNKIASQIAIHRQWGGVVPELASRAHVETVTPLTYEALAAASLTMRDIDAVAVTNRPGLIGALLVGLSFAKALAWANEKPLIGVNHIMGHVAAAYLTSCAPAPPYLALTVSGGHTAIYDVRSYTEFVRLGSTRDDAAGEAIDKIGRAMGLPYPGGAEMDVLARSGNREAFKLPSAAIAGDTLDFSFSGLKTYAVNLLHTAKQRGEELCREDLAASLCDTVARSLTQRVAEAVKLTGRRVVVVAGGVAANSQLRGALASYADSAGVALYIPPIALCGDNAAMIAAQGYYDFLKWGASDISLNAFPSA